MLSYMQRRWVLGSVAVVLAVALAWAGYNWQLLPLVLVLVVTLVYGLVRRRWVRGVLWGVGVMAALVVAAACYVFPVPVLPMPSGPHAIGVRYLRIATPDHDRLTPNPADRAVLYAKVWYPATAPGTDRQPFIDGGRTGLSHLANLASLPPFAFWHFSNVRTHSFTAAPPRLGPHPLLIFSHGYGSWFGQNVTTLEELASHGYVVVSVAHSHFTAFAAAAPDTLIHFPQVVPLDTTRDEEADYQHFLMLMQETDSVAFAQGMANDVRNNASVNRYARHWGQNVTHVLNYCLAQNELPESFLYRQLDTQRVGAFGMSFGGAASAQAALHDHRIKAVLNMDGTQYGDWIHDTLHVPALFLEAQRSPRGYSMYAPFRQRTTHPFYTVMFTDAAHWNFTDVNLYTPLVRWLGLLGREKGPDMVTEMNAQTLAFFNATLNNRPYTFTPHVLGSRVFMARF